MVIGFVLTAALKAVRGPAVLSIATTIHRPVTVFVHAIQSMTDLVLIHCSMAKRKPKLPKLPTQYCGACNKMSGHRPRECPRRPVSMKIDIVDHVVLPPMEFPRCDETPKCNTQTPKLCDYCQDNFENWLIVLKEYL